MVNAFNVETIDPLVAFATIEQAKGAIERAKLPPRQTIAEAMSSALAARLNCIRSGNQEWLDRWEAFLLALQKELPRGSGIDRGTTIDFDCSRGEKIVLRTSFHHMDENGVYDGWTEHTIRITPAFRGFDLSISGRNKNEIKEYLAEVYHCALAENCEAQP
jgi:hypothetical protein